MGGLNGHVVVKGMLPPYSQENIDFLFNFGYRPGQYGTVGNWTTCMVVVLIAVIAMIN